MNIEMFLFVMCAGTLSLAVLISPKEVIEALLFKDSGTSMGLVVGMITWAYVLYCVQYLIRLVV